MELFRSQFAAAKAAGLKITLHIAEVLFRVVLCGSVRSICASDVRKSARRYA